MKKFYFLSSCNTCQRILDHLDLGAEFELQDIKKRSIGQVVTGTLWYNSVGWATQTQDTRNTCVIWTSSLVFVKVYKLFFKSFKMLGKKRQRKITSNINIRRWYDFLSR